MNIKELRGKDVAALEKELQELQKAHFSLRMQQVTGQLPKTHETRRVRREIARVKTLIGSKK